MSDQLFEPKNVDPATLSPDTPPGAKESENHSDQLFTPSLEATRNVPREIEPGLRAIETDAPINDARSVLGEWIAASPNGVDEMAKQDAVEYLHRITGRTKADLYNNFDETMLQLTGTDLAPPTAAAATKQWWDNAWMAHEANGLKGQLFEQMSRGEDVTDIVAQIEELEGRMADADTLSKSPFFNNWVKPAMESLPLMIDPMLKGATVGMGASILAAPLTGGTSLLVPVVTTALIGTAATTAGTAVRSSQIQRNELLWELYQTTDANGNRIDPRLATTIAAVGGGINGLIESIQIAQLVPGGTEVFQGIANRFTQKLYVNRILRNKAIQAIGRYGSNVTDEALEELQQEVVNIVAVNLAADIENNTGAEFDRIGFEEAAGRALEGFSQGFRASALLALPSNVIQTGGDVAQAVSDRGQRPRTARTDGMESQLTAGPEAQAETTAEQAASPPEQGAMRSRQEIEADYQQATQDFAAAPEANAQRLLDLSVEIERLEASERRAARTAEAGDTDIATMTREQWQAQQQQEPEAAQPRQFDEAATTFRDRVRETTPNMGDVEADLVAELFTRRAEARGITTDQYLTEFDPRIAGDAQALYPELPKRADAPRALPQGKKGFFAFTEDAQAIIGLTADSDFSTWVHELGHKFQTEITGETKQAAERYYGVENEQWSVAQQEQFTEDLTTYMMEGKAPADEMRPFLAQVADYLKRIYQTMVGRTPVSDDIRSVFDRILTSDPDAQAMTQQAAPQMEAPPAREMVGPAVTEVPVDSIRLSRDVPQFKADADTATGVVEPLEAGGYERVGTAPIVVWERTNGDLEVITGRHRLDLARRLGEQTIPAQIVREADGFDQAQAETFDAESNIRDGQGTIDDYVSYFRGTEMSQEEASARGLISREKGATAFSISRYAGEELYSLYRAKRISAAKARAIAEAAPGLGEIQRAAMRRARDLSVQELNNFTTLLRQHEASPEARQTDMFGNDDSAVVEAEAMAKEAARKVNEIAGELSTLRQAQRLSTGDRATLVEQYGIKPGDTEAMTARIEELGELSAAWAEWYSSPVLFNEVREALGLSMTREAELYAMDTAPEFVESPDQDVLFQEPTDAQKIARALTDARDDLADPSPMTPFPRFEADRRADAARVVEILEQFGDRGIMLRHVSDPERYAIVHRSTRPEYAWQVSEFDARGPMSDTKYESTETMLRDVPYHANEYAAERTAGAPLQEVLYQSAEEAARDNNLVMHNLSAENLQRVTELGGFPRPSLAIAREAVPFTDFGEISLIASKEILDQADVYDRDVWSPRVPVPDYPVNDKALRDLMLDELEPVANRFPAHQNGVRIGYVSDLESYANGPEDMVSHLERNESARVLYLEEQGIGYEIPTTTTAGDIAGMEYEPLTEYFKDVPAAPNYIPSQGELHDLAIEAFREQGRLIAEFAGSEAERAQTIAEYEQIIEDAEGEGRRAAVAERKIERVARDHWNAAHPKIVPDTDQIRTDLFENWDHDDFVPWLREKVAPIFGEPRLKIGRSWKPYTVGNVVEAMKRAATVGGEEIGMTFGPKRAAAQAARTLDTIDEIKAENVRIDDEVRVEGFESMQQYDAAMRTRAIEYFAYDDTWDGFNAFYESIGAYLRNRKKRNPEALERILAKNEFTGIPSDVLGEFTDYAHELADMSVNYLEAKVRDYLTLDQFSAAVVPAGTPYEVRQALETAGLEVSEYFDHTDRWDRVIESSKARQDILFQPYAYHGTRHQFDRFTTKAMGTGEGAQAFGWGLYFTSSEAIGRYYGDTLASTETETLVVAGNDQRILDGSDESISDDVLSVVLRTSKSDNFTGAVRELTEIRAQWEDAAKMVGEPEDINRINQELDLIDTLIAEYSGSNPKVTLRRDLKRDPAYLYNTEIAPGRDAKLLDWREDAPADLIDRLIEAGHDVEALREKFRAYETPDDIPIGDTPVANGVLRHQYSEEIDRHFFDFIASTGGQFSFNFIEARRLLGAEAPGTNEQFYRLLSGELGSDQAASMALADLGYDGHAYPAGTMSAQETEATNYVIYSDDAIEVRDRILFQPDEPDAHEYAVRHAVEAGRWIPDEVLRDYEAMDWAKAEFETRERLRQEARQAIESGQGAEDFAEMQVWFDMEDHDLEYFQEIHRTAGQEPVKSVEQLSAEWVEGLSKPALSAYLHTVKYNRAADQLPHPVASAITKGLTGNQELTDAQYKKIMDQIRWNPSKWYEALSAATANNEDLRLLETAAKAHPEESKLRKLQRQVDELRSEDRRLNRDVESLQRQIDLDRKYERDLTGKIAALEARTTERETSLGEALDSARKEARHQARVAREQQRQALIDERAAVRKKIREQREARDYVKRLIKDVMRKPESTIAEAFASQIEAIQRAHDPRSFRRGKAGQIRKMLQEKLPDIGDEALKLIMQQELGLVSLRDMSLAELEAIHAEIDQLRIAGRQARMEQLTREQIELANIKESVMRSIRQGEDPEKILAKGSLETREATRTSVVQGIAFESLRPERIAKMFDGGDPGAVYNILWTRVNEITDAELRATDTRIEAGNEQMKALGVTQKALGREITADGYTYRADDVISMYIGLQNEDSAAALEHGNRIEPVTMNKMIDQLTPAEKRWGDWMIESFGPEQADRINDVLVQDKNIRMNKVERYFPMIRQNIAYDTHDGAIVDDVLGRSGARRQYANKGFTKSRIKISPAHQIPIRLGATAIWAEQIARQEKYINSGLAIKQMQRVFSDSQVQETIIQKYGDTGNKWVRKYINDFTNPNIYKVFDGVTKTMQLLRSHAALSYLGFNVVTMAKQAPSMAFFLSKSSPGDLIAASAQYLQNPKGMNDFVDQRDPQMKHRAIDRAFEELKLLDRNAYERLVQRTGKVGMAGIRFIDKQVTNIGWLAVYNRNIRQGKSESESIQAAQTAILTTQPAAAAKDIAQMYRQHEALNWFLMFTNQLNQVWNMTVFDIPNAVRKGRAGEALSYAAGIVVSAIGIGFIARGFRPPSEDEDENVPAELARDVFNQVVSSVPLVGGNFKSGFEGWFGTGVDPFPVAQAAGRATRSLTNPEATGEQRVRSIVNLLEQGLVVTGMPTVQPKRIMRAISEGEIEEIFGVRE